jgi:hypothetical protein
MPRRWIRIAAFALLLTALGAATTTAVAWGIALSRTYERFFREAKASINVPQRAEDNGPPTYHNGIVYWPAEHQFGITTLRASQREIVNRTGTTAELESYSGWGASRRKTLVEVADKPFDSRHPPRNPATESIERRYGWPVRSFWLLSQREWRNDVIRSTTCEGYFVFDPGSKGRAGDFGARGVQPSGPEFAFWLPIYILPLGFTLNTLFYAATWFVPLFGIRIARRTLRARRGLCTRCAYDLKGLAPSASCPECGQVSDVVAQPIP